MTTPFEAHIESSLPDEDERYVLRLSSCQHTNVGRTTNNVVCQRCFAGDHRFHRGDSCIYPAPSGCNCFGTPICLDCNTILERD